MKRLILLNLFCLLYGCITKQEIIGKYQYKGIYGINYSIEIKNDGSFNYYWQNGLNHGVEHGKWKLRRRKLIVNNDSQLRKPILEVNETSLESDTVFFEAKTFEGMPLSFANLNINNSQDLILDINGIGKIRKTIPLSIIRTRYLDYSLPVYKVKNAESNHFLLTFLLSKDSGIILKNEKLKIGKDRIFIKSNNLTHKKVTLIRINDEE